jgi:hypothetical protein
MVFARVVSGKPQDVFSSAVARVGDSHMCIEDLITAVN